MFGNDGFDVIGLNSGFAGRFSAETLEAFPVGVGATLSPLSTGTGLVSGLDVFDFHGK